MGYDMSQRDARFRIKEPDKYLALAALHELARRPEEIRWVLKREVAAAGTLELALALCGWGATIDEQGNVVGIRFEWEKAGDEDKFFAAIAPFVEPGSYIEMSGENGERWRWCFDGKSLSTKQAEITWEG